MKRQSVVVTGTGVVCSGGATTAEFTRTLLAGESALSLLNDGRVAHFGSIYAGRVPESYLDTSCLAGEDRVVRLADRAIREALSRSGVAPASCGDRAGLFLGTCSGPMLTIEELYGPSRKDVRTGNRPLYERKQYYDMARLLARRYSIGGPAYTVTTACSAFCAALTAAADLIRLGVLDVALVGGADSLSRTTLAGFVGLKAVNSSRCAPFSLPIGLNLGEGAGVVVLESFQYARARSAPIIATIEGYGLSNDAYHCSAPDPAGKGAAAAIAGALTDAALSIHDISYINAHGTGTEANDKAETRAIKRVCGETAAIIPPVSSTKAVVGHCLGAAGAVETVAALLCAAEGVLPPTVSFTGSREGCTLDYIGDKGRAWTRGSRWIKNNFAFGGNNASVVIRNSAPATDETLSHDLLDEPVVISAIGALSSAGIAPNIPDPDYFSAIAARVERTTDAYGAWPVCEVPAFNLADIDRRLSLRGVDRAGLLAASAAALALKAGRGTERNGPKMPVGLFMNIAQGSSWAERDHVGRLLDNNMHIDQINTFPFIVPNAVTGTVARALSLTGYNTTLCNGPGATLPGLLTAWSAIKNRHAASLLCGGVDDLTEAGLYDCVAAELGCAARPVLGEGAVMLLLEPLSVARSRGIEPLGTVISGTFSAITTVPARDAADAVDAFLQQWGVDSGDELLVCAGRLSGVLCSDMNARGYTVSAVDQTGRTGWMPCCQPLFDLAAALSRGSIGNTGCAKYILTVLCSPQDRMTIVLIDKNVTRKSE